MSILRFFRKPKANEGQVAPGGKNGSVLCMVLSQMEVPPDEATLKEALRAEFGSEATLRDGSAGVWMLNVPYLEHAFVSFIPAPIPTGEAESAADNLLWPDGSRFATHQSHVVLGSPGAHRDRIAAMLALTKLATAALRAFDGTGVYWGSGSVTVPREAFLSFAEDASREHLPLFLWCRFQPVRTESGKLGFYTVGLNQFGLMEIEVDHSSWEPSVLTKFVFNIAHYLIQSGPVIKDGDTVGETNEQRILLKYATSSQDPSRKAYKIVGT